MEQNMVPVDKYVAMLRSLSNNFVLVNPVTSLATDPIPRELIAHVVTGLFRQHHPEPMCYHNLEHTQKVVQHSGEIAAHCSLLAEADFIRYTAAWFHDTGQLFAPQERHEAESVALVTAFFKLHGISVQYLLPFIKRAIMATKAPQSPQWIIDEIVCDADTYHFGTEEFFKTDVLVRQEMEWRTGKVLNGWPQASLQLLRQHRYFTAYCRDLLDEGKQRNVALLERRLGPEG